MDLNTILSLGAALFNATRGGSAGSGGGSSFFTPAPTGGSSTGASTDWGSILSAIGQTAGQFKATPRAGASRKDVEKANRFNLLAGLLGGGAQIAGGVMSQQRKGEAYNALADILGGKATTTGQAMTPSETGAVGAMPTVTTGAPQSSAASIMALGKQYPDLADKFLELGMKQRQSEQDASKKLAEMFRKAQPSLQDRLAAATIAEKGGYAPIDISAKADSILAEETARRLSNLSGLTGISPTLRGLGGPDSFGATSQTPTPTVTTPSQAPAATAQPMTVDDVIKKAQQGEDYNVTLPPSAASDLQRGIKAKNIIDESPNIPLEQTREALLSPGTVSQTYPDTAEGRRQERLAREAELSTTQLESAKLTNEQKKLDMQLSRQKSENEQINKQYERSDKKLDFAAKRGDAIAKRLNDTQVPLARKNLETAYNLLTLDDPSGENHRQALVALQKTIDTSQVTLGESAAIDATLRSKAEQFKNIINNYAGKPFPAYKGEALKALKNDALQIGKALFSTANSYNQQYDEQTGGENPQFRPWTADQVKSTQEILDNLSQQIRGVTPTATPTVPTAQSNAQAQSTSPIAGLGGSREQQIRQIEQMLGGKGKFIGIR